MVKSVIREKDILIVEMIWLNKFNFWNYKQGNGVNGSNSGKYQI